MTDALPRVTRPRRDFVLRESRDAAALAAILGRDRLHAAYALAQLEPHTFPAARFWLCEGGSASGPGEERGPSLVCHSRGGLGDATYVMGPADGVARILALHPGPYQTFITARPSHLAALESAYRLRNPRTMLRMHVTRDRFRPVDGPTFRLRPTHVGVLNQLYRSDGGTGSYGPRHLAEGCYHGVREGRRLLAVAGTHSVGPGAGIAVVGNVYTHPSARGRGLATRVTSAVTASLLENHRDVVLSVDATNAPALRAYRRLGYRAAGEIVEAGGERRAGALTTALRRRLAAYRGREEGVEIVPG